jgi:predicted DNA-binding transcriptional regulator AlpA
MEDIEFWRMKTVVQKVGLSKTEIYRKIAEGTFPSPRPYPGNPKIKFWLSNEIRSWQRDTLAESVFEDLLQ